MHILSVCSTHSHSKSHETESASIATCLLDKTTIAGGTRAESAVFRELRYLEEQASKVYLKHIQFSVPGKLLSVLFSSFQFLSMFGSKNSIRSCTIGSSYVAIFMTFNSVCRCHWCHW